MIHDPVSPVDLLQQDHLHQLVRESHSGKTKLIICPFQDSIGKPKRTSDHKGDTALSLDTKFCDQIRQFYRIQHLSLYGQGNHVICVADMAKKPVTFYLLDLAVQCIRSLVRCLFICHLDKVQLAVAAKALGIFCDSVISIFLFNLSNCDNTNFHF